MLKKYINSFVSGIPYPTSILNNNLFKSFIEVIYYEELQFLKNNGNPTTLSVVRDVALVPGVLANIYDKQPVDARHSYDVYMLFGTLTRSTCKLAFLSSSEKIGAYSISALQAVNYENNFNSTVSYIEQDHYAFSSRTANILCEPASILINRVIPDQKQNEEGSSDIFWLSYLYDADKSAWFAKVGIASITRPLVSDLAGQTWKSMKTSNLFKITGQTPYIIRSQILENNFPELTFNSSQTAWNQVDTVLDSSYSADTKIYTSLAILTSEFANILSLDMIQGYFIMVPTRGINMIVEDYYKSNGLLKTSVQIAGIAAIIETAKYFKVAENSYFYLNKYLPIETLKNNIIEASQDFDKKLAKAAPLIHKASTSLISRTYQAYSETDQTNKFLISSYLLNSNFDVFSAGKSIFSNPTASINNFFINTKNIFFGSGMAVITPQSTALAQKSSKATLANNILEFTKAAPLSIVYHKIYEHYENKLMQSETFSRIITFEQDIIKNNFMNYLFNTNSFNSETNTLQQVEYCIANSESNKGKILSSLFIISHDIVIPTVAKFVLVNYSVKKSLEYLDINALSNSNPIKYTFIGISALILYNAEKTANIIEESLSLLDHYVSEAKNYISENFDPACSYAYDLAEKVVMAGINQDEL